MPTCCEIAIHPVRCTIVCFSWPTIATRRLLETAGFLYPPLPMSPWTMANRHFAIAVAAIALVIGLVHAGSLGNGFHYDDGHSVVRNPHIRTLDLPRFLLDSRTFSDARRTPCTARWW